MLLGSRSFTATQAAICDDTPAVRAKAPPAPSISDNENYRGDTETEESHGGGFDEDFDFSRGLASFDKRAVFDEIRVSGVLPLSVRG